MDKKPEKGKMAKKKILIADIIAYKNQEAAEKAIEKAAKLGYSQLILGYSSLDKLKSEKRKNKVEQKFKRFKNIKLNYCLISDEDKELRKALALKIITIKSFSNKSSLTNRDFEKPCYDFITGIEKGTHKDYMHQRNSGLNHVIAKELAKKGIGYLISIKDIIESKNRVVLLGRIMQNIRICKKYNLAIAIASFAEDSYGIKGLHDIISLLSCLGLDAKNAKKAVSCLHKALEKKSDKSIICNGIRLVKENIE